MFVGVIVSSPDGADRAEQYERAAGIAIGEHDLERVIVLAWTPQPIPPPYFALVYYDRAQP